MVAEYERAKLLDRCRRGKRHAAATGSVSALGHAPYGYRYLPKAPGLPARYEVVPDEARIVQQIFAWVGHERLSLNAVCRRLAERGIPSRRGWPRWSRYSVYALLKNPAYHGRAQFGKTRLGERRPQLRPGRGRPEHPRHRGSLYPTPVADRIDIAVPALVSAELFAVVQEQLAENRRRQRQRQAGARYLLQGLLVCKVCGYALCGKRNTTPARWGRLPKQYVYYGCQGSMAGQHGGRAVCATPLLSAEALEQAVWQDVRALLADPGRVAQEYQRRLRQRPTAEADRPAARAHQRRQLEQGLARLLDAYTEGIVDKKEFYQRARRLKERLAQLAAEEAAAARQEGEEADLQAAVRRLQDFAQAIDQGLSEVDWQTRREIIRTLVKRIEVGEAEVRLIYRVDPRPFVSSPSRGHLQDCSRRHALHALQGCWGGCNDATTPVRGPGQPAQHAGRTVPLSPDPIRAR
jgi:site-specific DNA recombinase